MSDAAVRKRTGRDWAGSVAELDHAGAVSMLHRDIAKYVDENYDIGGWWAQTVTVSYERIRGLREPGQRRSGRKAAGFDVNKSKTIPVPIGKLYRAFSQKRWRSRWLGDVEMTVRTSTVDKSMRVSRPDETAVDLYFTAKGEAKSTVTVQHRKLPDKAAADGARAFWGDRLRDLSEMLTA